MNEKRHISVNDIDFYERNNDDVYANKKTIQGKTKIIKTFFI